MSPVVDVGTSSGGCATGAVRWLREKSAGCEKFSAGAIHHDAAPVGVGLPAHRLVSTLQELQVRYSSWGVKDAP